MDNIDYVVYIIHYQTWEKHQAWNARWEGSMDGHAHFWYCASSAIAHLIIHGGWSLITYSLTTAELELATDEVPMLQVGQLSCTYTTSYLWCHVLVVWKKLVHVVSSVW